MDMPNRRRCVLGRASRRKRERRQGIFRVPSFAEQEWEAPPLPGPPPGVKGMKKISACLIELVDPLISEASDLDECRAILSMAAMAWNLSHLQAATREESVVGAIESSGDGGIDDAFTGAFLLELAERKLRLFPDDPRVVLSWKVKKVRDGFHVTVEGGLPGRPSLKLHEG